MSVIVSGTAVYLTGVVGEDPFFDHFKLADVILALAEFEDTQDLTIHLNSPGGWAEEGAAIHALLSARSGKSNVIIEGLAASAASLIAMAGDKITMAAGAVMMIHDPHTTTSGNSSDHERSVQALESISKAYARIYSHRSGKSMDECRNIMKAETWFSPEEAVAARFADAVGSQRSKAFAAFDYEQFQHAPQPLVALSRQNHWTRASVAPAHSHEKNEKEKILTKDVAAQVRAEVTARIRTIMALPEAKGRSELAEHIAFETELTPEEAGALLSKVKDTPASGSGASSYEQQRLAAAAGAVRVVGALAMPSAAAGPGAPGGGLVANMKRRHGITE